MSESRRSSTATLIGALHILAEEIQGDGGIANAAIAEAAQRMEDMHDLLRQALVHVITSAEAEQIVDGYSATDALVKRIKEVL